MQEELLANRQLLIGWRSDVVDLQNHLDQLRGQDDLLLLGVQRFDHVVLLHVRIAGQHAVDSQRGRVLGNVTRFQLGQGFDRRQTAILGQSQRHRFQGDAERTEGILFQRGQLVSFAGDGQRAADFRSTTAVHDAGVLDEGPNHTQGIVDRSFGFGCDHLVATSDQNGDGAGVFALLDDQHLVLGRSEA